MTILQQLLLLFLLFSVSNCQLTSIFTNTPKAEYPLFNSTSLTSNFTTPSAKLAVDSQGNIYTCITILGQFSIKNFSYTSGTKLPTFFKFSPNFELIWAQPYSQAGNFDCDAVEVRKNWVFYVVRANRDLKFAKADFQTGFSSPVLVNSERLSHWDWIDEELLLIGQSVDTTFGVSTIFAPVCPLAETNMQYLALGVINTTSQALITYRCFNSSMSNSGVNQLKVDPSNSTMFYIFGAYTTSLKIGNLIITPPYQTYYGYFAKVCWTDGFSSATVLENLGQYGSYSRLHMEKDGSKLYISARTFNIAFEFFGKQVPVGHSIIRLSLLPQPSVDWVVNPIPEDSDPPGNVYENYLDQGMLYFFYRILTVTGGAVAKNRFDFLFFRIEEKGLIHSYMQIPLQHLHDVIYPFATVANASQIIIVGQAENATFIGQPFAKFFFAKYSFPNITFAIPPPTPVADVVVTAPPSQIGFNGTNFVVYTGFSIDQVPEVSIIFNSTTVVVSIDPSLQIQVNKVQLNFEEYSSQTLPSEFNVYNVSQNRVMGQLVGNGYQISSNARIEKLTVCIQTVSKLFLQKDTYVNPAIAIRIPNSNRFGYEKAMKVNNRNSWRQQNRVCTQVSTSSPIVYPALVDQLEVEPQASVIGVAASNTVSYFSLLLLLLFYLLRI